MIIFVSFAILVAAVEGGDVCDLVKCCHWDFMVSGNYPIPDDFMTASSQWDRDHAPTRARLGTKQEGSLRGGWTPSSWTLSNQWIQVDIGENKEVIGVVTQGRAATDVNQWVTSYKVSFSKTDNSTAFQFVESGRGDQTFDGNSDQNTGVFHMFDPVEARYVRIHPKTWYGYPSMRFDVIGCRMSKVVSCNTS